MLIDRPILTRPKPKQEVRPERVVRLELRLDMANIANHIPRLVAYLILVADIRRPLILLRPPRAKNINPLSHVNIIGITDAKVSHLIQSDANRLSLQMPQPNQPLFESSCILFIVASHIQGDEFKIVLLHSSTYWLEIGGHPSYHERSLKSINLLISLDRVRYAAAINLPCSSSPRPLALKSLQSCRWRHVKSWTGHE